MDPAPIAEGLAKNPLAWGLAIALAAVAFLFRELSRERDQRILTMREDAKEHRELLKSIVPLSEKLAEGIEILEDVTDTLTKE